ncbi:FISUMP domain-containing protein [Bacteroidota bacterium]
MKRKKSYLPISLLIALSLLFIISGCKKENIIENIITGTFIDTRDNKEYNWVKIGSQTWMAENLNFETRSGSWCYNNNANNCIIYGLLYKGETALADNNGNGIDICPIGWHLPTDEEWKTLEENLGMPITIANEVSWRNFADVGKKLKTELGWDFNNGNNLSKFEALPGGYMTVGNAFTDAGKKAYFWTASEYNYHQLWYRRLAFDMVGVYRYWMDKERSFSVRCVKDE